jgi:hypothetical protein
MNVYEAPAPSLGLKRPEEGATEARPFPSGSDIAKMQFAAAVQLPDAADHGLLAGHDDIVVAVGQHLVKLPYRLVAEPAVQGWSVVVMIADAELNDGITPHAECGLRIRCGGRS